MCPGTSFERGAASNKSSDSGITSPVPDTSGAMPGMPVQ